MDAKWLQSGQVVGHDADRHRVYVEINGQRLGASVPVLMPQVNGIQAHYNALPQIGSWGVIGFVGGYDINPFFLGCYVPALVDAIDGSSPFEQYDAHFSGVRTYQAENGSIYHYRPDGTYILIGASSPPVLHKHTVDSSQTRQQTPLTASDDPTAVSGPIRIHHHTGSEIQMDENGNIILIVKAGQTLQISQSGSTTVADPLVLFNELKNLFNTHTHGGVTTGGGVTGVPVVLMDTGVASKTALVDK